MVWKLANSSIENCIVPVIISSPELKARELFGSSVVRTYICLLCTFSSRTVESISTKLGTKHPLIKGTQGFTIKGPFNFQKEI